ncbi:transcription factor MYB [Pycnococcus provasolii]
MGVERDGKSCRQRWLNHLATGVNREPFSRDEDAKIIALQRELGNRWSKIAHALGSNRLDSAVRERWKVALNPAKQHKLAEDTTSPPAAGHPSLPPAVLVSGEVAAACPNLQHSKLDLRQQLGRDIDTSNVQLADCKGQRYVRWTDEEDSNLRELVQTHGAKDWDGISLKMGGERNAKGCRQRWLDHLDTGVNREPFSRDEDAKIIALQRELGNRWSKIAHALGSNRLDSAVRERWKVALNRAKQQKLAEDGRLENSAGLPVVAVAAAPAASPSSWTPLTGVKRRQPEDDTSNVADGQPAHYANQLMFVPFAWPLPGDSPPRAWRCTTCLPRQRVSALP